MKTEIEKNISDHLVFENLKEKNYQLLDSLSKTIKFEVKY